MYSISECRNRSLTRSGKQGIFLTSSIQLPNNGVGMVKARETSPWSKGVHQRAHSAALAGQDGSENPGGFYVPGMPFFYRQLNFPQRRGTQGSPRQVSG